ncbi:hypothetical protein MSNKSG1_15512 [Marinobacter santoriniensis NKSG1]|uniref:DUF547 domain-containing protein n=1 Tax=Marinobacter santoriniensis NKSG1 TaxID=1288826 RepID=M7CRI9_9GAMM|nr:DUF547 domain-containing protein [Marinobacter santoriniensis]EMP54730.1 hypothetical protein MSNKSG1_15512 [Marinobacter santoriniensis NKSG1]
MRSLPILTLVVVMMPAWALAGVNDNLYEGYQQLLNDYLVEQTLPGDGLVSAFDYTAALADEQVAQTIAQQTAVLRDFDPDSLDGREQTVAFWINAYNFFMLSEILTDRPDGKLVSSVWDYGGRVNPFVDSVFERETFVVGSEQMSLNDIEKGRLLGKSYADRGWKDARVHFAVNCASVGCPPLRQQIYTADNLEEMLKENTRRAFSTPYHLKIQGDTLYVTELFKWYEQDFVDAAGSVRGFIRHWADNDTAAEVAKTSSLDYIDYDWSLNRPSNFSGSVFKRD